MVKGIFAFIKKILKICYDSISEEKEGIYGKGINESNRRRIEETFRRIN